MGARLETGGVCPLASYFQPADRPGLAYLATVRDVSQARTANQVVDGIVAQIRAGRFKVGDRLPGENALAAEFGVSRASVREALRIMEAVGAVKVRPGKGCYVLRRPDETDGGSIWLSWLLTGKDEFLALLEFREALETKLAALAAERATDRDLAEMGAVLDEMGVGLAAADLSPERALELDLRFHRALARAGRNPFLAEATVAALDAVQAYRRGAITIPNRIRISWEDHKVIYEALCRRDGAAALAAMARHIQKLAEDVRSQDAAVVASRTGRA